MERKRKVSVVQATRLGWQPRGTSARPGEVCCVRTELLSSGHLVWCSESLPRPRGARCLLTDVIKSVYVRERAGGVFNADSSTWRQ